MTQMVRTSAILSVILLLSVQLLHLKMVLAATFVVGDAAGWTFNVAAWPNGKHFKAGDQLVFKYDPNVHNVVAVNRNGYDSCAILPPNAPEFTSGHDQIKLKAGPNYFICGVPGHCEGGMKIAVIAK
ncbi:basic blue protein-like [Mangifera indica]|uniref:basic blue protein-like n=1 Tax=Mangifera indica TaxID=29780 RepID=UPI001CFBE0CB|nr:basic blue protein-like [Mangifera indica]